MKTFLILFILIIALKANAQNVLTVENAVNIALKNNYGIQVAANDAAISKLNNTRGNAGMLPNVALTGSGNYAVNTINQKYSDGTENKYTPLKSMLFNTGVELTWTLFDGGKMFVTKAKLAEIQAFGELQFKNIVLQTQYDVVAAYYEITRQKQVLNSVNEIISYNTELVKILQTAFNGGSLLKTNLLQSKIDLNVYKENAVNQQFAIDVAKKNLNHLLGLQADSAFEVVDSIPVNYSINKSELTEKLNTSNTSILAVQKQLEIAKLALKEFTKAQLPTINFKTGYYLSQTDNSTGSMLKSHTLGPQFGGSISIPIYQSGKIQRQIAISKLEVQSAEYDLEERKLAVKNELLNAIAQFENQQKLRTIEKENKELTRENLEICIQRMKQGQSTSLEEHQAQENYVQSCTRLTNFEFNLKIAETKLKQLMSIL